MDARIARSARETYAGAAVPPDLSTAYAIQSRAVRLWNDELAGFKVGGIPLKFRDQYPADWLARPVFAKNVFQVLQGQPKSPRMLYMLHHGNDEHPDDYASRPDMTVFAFGRRDKEKYLMTPQTFSIGFVGSTDYADVEKVMLSLINGNGFSQN